LKALGAKKTPETEEAYRAWLFRILRNAFIDQLRREKTAADAIDEEKFSASTEYWHGDERYITVLNVKIEMARPPRRHREIIALIDIAGLSYAEAANLLDVPTGTIMSRISRARRMLLEAIGSSNVHELPQKKTKRMQ